MCAHVLVAANIPSALGRGTGIPLLGLDVVEPFAPLLAGTRTSYDARPYLATTSQKMPERGEGYRPRGELLCSTAATEYSMRM